MVHIDALNVEFHRGGSITGRLWGVLMTPQALGSFIVWEWDGPAPYSKKSITPVHGLSNQVRDITLCYKVRG